RRTDFSLHATAATTPPFCQWVTWLLWPTSGGGRKRASTRYRFRDYGFGRRHRSTGPGRAGYTAQATEEIAQLLAGKVIVPETRCVQREVVANHFVFGAGEGYACSAGRLPRARPITWLMFY